MPSRATRPPAWIAPAGGRRRRAGRGPHPRPPHRCARAGPAVRCARRARRSPSTRRPRGAPRRCPRPPDRPTTSVSGARRLAARRRRRRRCSPAGWRTHARVPHTHALARAGPVFVDRDGNMIEVLCCDYGMRSGVQRLYQDTGPRIPLAPYKLAMRNFAQARGRGGRTRGGGGGGRTPPPRPHTASLGRPARSRGPQLPALARAPARSGGRCARRSAPTSTPRSPRATPRRARSGGCVGRGAWGRAAARPRACTAAPCSRPQQGRAAAAHTSPLAPPPGPVWRGPGRGAPVQRDRPAPGGQRRVRDAAAAGDPQVRGGGRGAGRGGGGGGRCVRSMGRSSGASRRRVAVPQPCAAPPPAPRPPPTGRCLTPRRAACQTSAASCARSSRR